jgi:CRISPR-associated protein Cmr5
MATLEQQRAAFALQKVESVRDKPDYKPQLLKLPARLHNNGLGQTVAFYLSAGRDKPEVAICGWIEEWLRREGGTYPPGSRLIDNLTGQSEAKYREASAEVRALAVWLKRFAEAFLEGKAG